MSWTKWIPAFRGPGRTPTAAQSPPKVVTDARIDALYCEGIQALEASQLDTAVRCLQQVVEVRYDDARAHHRLGLAYFRQGLVDEAADCFALAAHFEPEFAEAHFDLGRAAKRQGSLAKARSGLERAIALRPNYAEAYNALGAIELELGDLARSVAALERAIAIAPNCGPFHSDLGYVLFRDLGEYERGEYHIRKALQLNSRDANAWCNQTIVLLHQGRLEEAICVCDQLLAANPELHEARLNRAIAALKLGRYAAAWPDYEARKQVRSNYISRPFTYPEWDGQAPGEKTVLVYAEQGLGDEIMFASCIPDLQALGAYCIVECSSRLEALFRRSFPATSVHAGVQSAADTAWLEREPRVDFQVAIGSLPRHFRRHASDFPELGGYLRADESRVAHWCRRLGALGAGLKIGISWSGGTASTRRNLRSIDLAEWLSILQLPACHFVSLQFGDIETELSAFKRAHDAQIHYWPEAHTDYDETAALISAVDLVISVQTAVVHLSGALGKPTWVMVPAVAEWRYLQQGESMPWYPSVRLFRQQRENNWRPVIDDVAKELRKRTS